MSFIRAGDDAPVTCDDTTRSIRDYSENAQVLLSGVINREDGNYNDNNHEINIRMVSCSEFQVFIFISNNIDDICFNRARLHLHKKGYSKFSLNFVTLMKSMMMNRFGGMVDRQKASGIISSWDHCQRSSTARIFDTPRARFEPELRP